MVNIIGVRFQVGGKLYFFDPGEAQPSISDRVLVETSHGISIGEVILPCHMVDESHIVSPLKPILRMATSEDIEKDKENRRKEKEAFRICQEKIEEHKLDMKLVRAEIGLESGKILFYFTANGRVDFRALVKDLAGVFKTRIELRQIGVRDEARLIGGLGPCGLPICCDTFLADFEPVSIKMAKEQKLSLNPSKISGVCGRLMCCLKYEEDQYESTRKRMPKVGKEIQTEDGPAVVVEQNILRESVVCRLNRGETSEMKEYSLDDLVRMGVARPYVPESAPAESPAAEEDADTAEQDRGPVMEDEESVLMDEDMPVRQAEILLETVTAEVVEETVTGISEVSALLEEAEELQDEEENKALRKQNRRDRDRGPLKKRPRNRQKPAPAGQKKTGENAGPQKAQPQQRPRTEMPRPAEMPKEAAAAPANTEKKDNTVKANAWRAALEKAMAAASGTEAGK